MAMSYDGMNGSDMDTSDSRKRPLDGESDSGVTKRSNQGGGDNVHMKILVPSVAAGAIIGKGGETIAQIQKEAGARVKMSKANDFYPGTTERVCLIMGAYEAVRGVHNFVMEKIREKPDPNPKLEETKSNFERHRQVKILVPNSTAGMIIGKAGNYIKQIKEESGAYVQISQKSKETNLPERCVTIAGDIENNMKAVDMILQKIVEDPQSGSCPNISYADYTGPVASANPTGSPFANTPFSQNRTMDIGLGNNTFSANAFGIGFNGNSFNNSGMPNLALTAGPMSGSGSNSVNGSMENLRLALRSNGFNDQATEEISFAINTLANYGMLGVGMGLGLGASSALSSLGNIAQAGSGFGTLNLGSPSPATGVASLITPSAATPTSSATSPFLNTSSGSSGTPGNIYGPVGSGLGSSGSTGASSSLFSSSSPSMGSERYAGSPMLNESFGSASYASPVGMSNAIVERSPNLNQNSFGIGTGLLSSTEDKNGAGGTVKQEIEVPENIVGAILGPGGKGIVELQQYTGTNIQISKKGVYNPGTRNRIVSITGTPTSIRQAQYLIQQRIQQEEVKRARQVTSR